MATITHHPSGTEVTALLVIHPWTEQTSIDVPTHTPLDGTPPTVVLTPPPPGDVSLTVLLDTAVDASTLYAAMARRLGTLTITDPAAPAGPLTLAVTRATLRQDYPYWSVDLAGTVIP